MKRTRGSGRSTRSRSQSTRPLMPGMMTSVATRTSRKDPSAEEILVHEHGVAPVQPRVHREEGGQQEEADARPVEAPREPAVPGGRRELAADRLEGHVRQGPAPPWREPALRYRGAMGIAGGAVAH